MANLFTVVIPIGRGNESESIFISDYWPVVQAGHSKVNYITVPELATIPLYSDADLNSDYHRKTDYANAITRFGKIWKTVDFENANSPEKLFMYAKDWMKNNFMPELTQWSVTALDMKIVDRQNQALYVGDRVNLIHPEVDQSYPGMTVISCDYDLYNPQNNKYVIGIPNQEINSAYGVKNKVDKGTGTKKSKKGGGGGRNKPPPEDPNAELEAQIAEMRARLLTEYSYKTDSGGDIHRDDPIAYNMYNTDGTEKSRAEIVKSIQESSANLFYTKQTKQMEIINEAIRRGVSPDDPQLLIDLTPKEKAKQNKFKSDSEYYYVNTVGMTMEESALLLNDSASQSWLAALVDDDGNWTETAYSKGCMIWNDRDNIKQQAINARKGFAGTRKQNGFDVWSTVKDSVNSVTSKVGNWLSADGLLNTFDIGNLWTDVTSGKSFGDILGISGNTDGGTLGNTFNFLKGMFTGEDKGGTIGNVFKLFTNNTVVNGENGSAEFGSGGDLQNGRKVTINEAFSYTATVDGVTKTFTVPAGSIALDDLHFTKTYDSVYAKFLATDQLVATKATITSLNAVEAKIDKITGETIAASTQVRAATGAFTNLYGANIYYKPADMGAVNIVSSIVSSYKFVESGGSIYLQGVKIGGTSWENLANFNIAATNKYLTDVAAARVSGRNSVYVNNVYVDAGASKTVNLHYTDPQTGHEMNTGQSFTVSAGEGSSANLYDEDRTFTYNDTWTFRPKSGYDGFSEFIVRVKVPKSNTGCFVAGSLVKLFNGEERPIEELTVGTQLLSYNEETEQYTQTEILAVQTFKHKSDIHEIRLSNGNKVTLTGSHPVLTKEGWKAINVSKAREEHFVDVGQLLEGDEILAEEGAFVKVLRIVHRDDLTDCDVYNLDVEPVDTYIVDGVVVHNADSK